MQSEILTTNSRAEAAIIPRQKGDIMVTIIKVTYKNGNTLKWQAAEGTACITGDGNLIWCAPNVTDGGWTVVSTKHMEKVVIDGVQVLPA